MSKAFICDQCEGVEQYMPFEVVQVTDEFDDDGDPVEQLLHFCTARCLCNFAMGLAMTFESDVPANPPT